MEGTPSNVDVQEIIQLIEQTEGIESIHDLHIWTITSGTNALSCHAVVNDQLKIAESEHILRKIEHNLQHKDIKHVTIQLETALHRHDDSILCKLENDHEHHHDDK